MIVVIQCAAKKRANAGCLRAADGRKVLFVGDPVAAPPSREFTYARPDDPSDFGISWRELLVQYNRTACKNPFGLCCAADLYVNAVYNRLVKRFGAENTYILSAGWGLIGSAFLTPNYDITFSTLKPSERYKSRKKEDVYHDFCSLPDSTEETMVFLGSKNYIPLFCELTREMPGPRIIFFNSEVMPEAPGCSLERFVTKRRTNWHYECADAFVGGKPGALSMATDAGAREVR